MEYITAGTSGKPAESSRNICDIWVVKTWREDVHSGAFAWILTHPSPAWNTIWGAAFPQTRPRRWACAGKSPRRASRSSCSSAGTCGRTWRAYSSPGGEGGEKVQISEKNANAITGLGLRVDSRNLCSCDPVSPSQCSAGRRWWPSSARTRGRGFCGG